MVEAPVADGAHESLGERVRTGRADRARIVSTPIEAKTSLKLAVNLASRSRMRKPVEERAMSARVAARRRSVCPAR